MGSLVNRNIENSNRSNKQLGYVNSNSCGALFKKRKVSATRIFPPGCGPNAPRMDALPQTEKKKKRSGKKSMDVSASKRKKLVTIIPIVASSIRQDSLSERLGTNGVSFNKRKVSATRVFPTGRGLNAPRMYAIPQGRKKEKTTDIKPVNVPVSDYHKASEVKLVLQKVVTNCGVLFKKRKVSCTRVFPPGCGPYAPHMYVNPHFETEKMRTEKKQVDFAMSDCSESSDDRNASMLDKSTRIPMNLKSTDTVEKAITNAVIKDEDVLKNKMLFANPKSWIPSQWSISTTGILKESLLKVKCKQRKISAMREFPLLWKECSASHQGRVSGNYGGSEVLCYRT